MAHEHVPVPGHGHTPSNTVQTVRSTSAAAYLSTTTMSSDSALVDEKQALLPKHRHPNGPKHVLVIHGGAGTILRERSSPEQEARFHAAIRAALQAGDAILNSGGEAMDAVVAAVSIMEGTECQSYG